MSEEIINAEDQNDPRRQLVDAAFMIAKALQDSSTPDEALQVLSIATGMILCASSQSRGDIVNVLDIFGKQVNLWCDFEEHEKSASWLRAH